MNVTTRTNVTPLTPQLFQVLVALAAGPSTGYSLMRQISEDTAGRMGLQAGTVYPALRRLLELYHIEECEGHRLRPGRTARRYRLTGVGEQTLAWELSRLEEAVELGRGRLGDLKLRRKNGL